MRHKNWILMLFHGKYGDWYWSSTGHKIFCIYMSGSYSPDVIVKGNYVLSLVGHCLKCFFRENIYVTFY